MLVSYSTLAVESTPCATKLSQNGWRGVRHWLFAHLLNPRSSWTAAVFIAVEAGVTLAAAYITTRRLWMPIGMHFAWNFTQGGVFGVPVSGIPVQGMLDSKLTGPELISGGAFGAENSIFAVLVCTSAAIYLLARAARNGQIIRPFWARKQTPPVTPDSDKPVMASVDSEF